MVRVWDEKAWPDFPWRALCSTCGCDGRFATRDEANSFGGTHVSRRGGEVIYESPIPLAPAIVATTPLPKPIPKAVLVPFEVIVNKPK